MRKVANGDYVKFCYKGRFLDGEVFDDQQDCDPIEIRVGSGETIPGIEEALIGMGPKEKKTLTLTPDQAYGERDERMKRTVLKSNFPFNFEPYEGQLIAFKTPKGEQLPAMVVQINKDEITIDFNHPLAGKSLVYELEVAEINDEPCGAPSRCSDGGGCCCT